MIDKLKPYLQKVFVTESMTNKDFQHTIIRKTASRGLHFTLFIVIIEFFMILVSFFVPSFFYEGYVLYYRYHYIALFVVSLIGIFLLRHYVHKNESFDKPLYIISMLVISFSICWGASVTLLDQLHSSQISVYLTFILLMAIGANYPPLKMLFIYLIVHIPFVILIPFYQNTSEIIFSTRLNSSLFLFFAWLISRQLYSESYSLFEKDQLIAKQTTDLQKSNDMLRRISRRDPMTDLYNRLSLDDILNEEWLKAVHNDYTLSLLMIDIDDFKPFNDTYGHIKGDLCIISVCQVLSKYANEYNGYAFRYGGDEFCLLYKHIDSSTLHVIETNIRQEAATINIAISENVSTSIHLSIGSSIIKADLSLNPWILIEKADESLYREKASK